MTRWDGLANTNAIIAQAGEGTDYAAGLCKSYNAAGFLDWYLPTSSELELFNNSISIINEILGEIDYIKFDNVYSETPYYWSSNDNLGGGMAIFYDFDLKARTIHERYLQFRVRAVRRF